MFVVTRFCVQPYERRRGRLVAVEPQQHYEREAALGAANRMRRRVAMVEVYEVTGWPVYDLWDRPKLLSRSAP